MIFACIAAGGTGSRMGLDIPKQFAKINGKPIIIYTLEQFLKVEEIDRIYIGCHKDWAQYLRDIIKEQTDAYDKTEVIDGGKDRNETILGCAYKIKEQYGDKGVAPNGGNPYTVRYTLLDNSGKETKDLSKAVCIQVNEFTMNEYYLISHVMNRSMAGANVLVTVGEGATWNVTQDCYVKGLVNKGTIKIANGAKLYVNGAPYDGTAPQAGEVPQPPGTEAQPNPEAEESAEEAEEAPPEVEEE